MCRSFVAWVNEKNFIAERTMTIRYCKSASLVDSTYFDLWILTDQLSSALQQNYFRLDTSGNGVCDTCD